MSGEINNIKPKWSLLDMNILHQMAYLMTLCEEKHSGDHYQKTAIDRTEYENKIMRHFIDYKNGKTDEESKLNPLIHLMSDAMILLSQSEGVNKK